MYLSINLYNVRYHFLARYCNAARNRNTIRRSSRTTLSTLFLQRPHLSHAHFRFSNASRKPDPKPLLRSDCSD